MRRSKFIALLMVSVMVCMVAQPAFAWWGGGYVDELIGKFINWFETGEKVSNSIDSVQKIYKAKNNNERVNIVIDTAVEYGKENLVRDSVKVAAVSAIKTSAVPTVVKAAAMVGVTAKTGTAIGALSGAAAVNATLCAIGTPIVTALGITVAPAVVGGVIVAGGTAAVCYGVHKIIDWIW